MTNKRMINYKMLILLTIAVLMVLFTPGTVFADDEGEPKEESSVYTLEGFWARYNPEDVGYHVIDPKEKIWYLESENLLEFQIIKEDGDDSLLNHFVELNVKRVITTFDDPSAISFESETPPSYEVSEEDGILTFEVNKDNPSSLKEGQRYEFAFVFDDGIAYGFACATERDDLLCYTEEGHVWIVEDTESSDPLPEPGGVLVQNTEVASNSEPTQLIAEENENDSRVSNITVQVVVVCLFVVSFILFMIYRLKGRKK